MKTFQSVSRNKPLLVPSANRLQSFAIFGILLLITTVLIAGLTWRQRSETTDSTILYEYHFQSARLAEHIAKEAELIVVLLEPLFSTSSSAQAIGYAEITGHELPRIQDATYTIILSHESLHEILLPEGSDDLVKLSLQLNKVVRQLQTATRPENLHLDAPAAPIRELARITNLRAQQMARLHNSRFESKAEQMQLERRRADIILVIIFVLAVGAGMFVIHQMLQRMSLGQLKLEQNESRLRAVTNNVPGLVFQAFVDDTGLVEILYQSSNPALDIDDQNRGGFPGLQSLFNNVGPSDQQRLAEAIQSSNRNYSDFDMTFEYEAPDTVSSWYKVAASVDLKAEGRPVWTGLLLDVTQEKVYESELLVSKIQADDANQAKSTFLSSMSHEIRTPMNGVIGLAQVLRMQSGTEDGLSEKNIIYVDQIIKSGNHLLSIVDDVLDLSRIESKDVDMTIEAVNLKPLLEECISIIEMDASKSNIKIILANDPLDLPTVSADKMRLKQTLLNILSNAVKYNRKDGTITLSVLKEGDIIRFSITDTGKGISKENQADLFKPFNRLGLESSDISGSGIGLLICRNFLNHMNGTIELESTEGVGTTVTIELPASQNTTTSTPDQDHSEHLLNDNDDLQYLAD